MVHNFGTYTYVTLYEHSLKTLQDLQSKMGPKNFKQIVGQEFINVISTKYNDLRFIISQCFDDQRDFISVLENSVSCFIMHNPLTNLLQSKKFGIEQQSIAFILAQYCNALLSLHTTQLEPTEMNSAISSIVSLFQPFIIIFSYEYFIIIYTDFLFFFSFIHSFFFSFFCLRLFYLDYLMIKMYSNTYIRNIFSNAC